LWARLILCINEIKSVYCQANGTQSLDQAVSKWEMGETLEGGHQSFPESQEEEG
jgi:hypothetical protein